MHLTASQRKGILFILVFFQLAVMYHLLDRWLHPFQPYDFSPFEEKFYTRYDSIQQYLQQPDSNRTAEADPDPPVRYQAFPAAPGGTANISLQKQAADQSRLPLNLNTATLEELTALPRIGPTIAARILEYRTRHGAFVVKKDLTKVKGIGAKTYEQIQHLVTVE